MIAALILKCSSCDDYRFVDGPDGFVKVRCPDCMEHCLAHPAERVLGGRCPSCLTEASIACEVLAAVRRTAALATIGVTV